jgi:ribosomal protein S18 acetylase RimI-like enzyme
VPGALPPGVRVALVHRSDELDRETVRAAASLIAGLVADGAALGWVDPPRGAEVAALLRSVAGDAAVGDAALAVAYDDEGLAGLGYWRRYRRPTHRPHANLERLAVSPSRHRHGVGRALTEALVAAAREAGVEQLTLDLRGDNAAALGLYTSQGFQVYGTLSDFVAVGAVRYDKLFCVLDLRAPTSGAAGP